MSISNMNFRGYNPVDVGRKIMYQPQTKIDETGGTGATNEGTGMTSTVITQQLDNILKDVQSKKSEVSHEITNLYAEMQSPNTDDSKMKELTDKIAKLQEEYKKLAETEKEVKQAQSNAGKLTVADVTAFAKQADAVINPPKMEPVVQTEATEGVTEVTTNTELEVLAARHTELTTQMTAMCQEMDAITTEALNINNEKQTLTNNLQKIRENRPNPNAYYNSETKTYDSKAYEADMAKWKADIAKNVAEFLAKNKEYKEKCNKYEELKESYEALRAEQQEVLAQIEQLIELPDVGTEETTGDYDEKIVNFINNDLAKHTEFDSIDEFEEFCGEYFADLDIDFGINDTIIISSPDGKASIEIVIGDG